MLFVKKCQSAFPARGKEAEALLLRHSTLSRRPEAGEAEDTLEQAPLTSAFFCCVTPSLVLTFRSLNRAGQPGVLALSGVKGSVLN